MDFKQTNIPKLARNQYNFVSYGKSSSGSSSEISASSGGESGLPYTIDENGNYIVNGNTIFNGSEQQWKNED